MAAPDHEADETKKQTTQIAAFSWADNSTSSDTQNCASNALGYRSTGASIRARVWRTPNGEWRWGLIDDDGDRLPAVDYFFSMADAQAAAEEWWLANGGWHKVPSPLRHGNSAVLANSGDGTWAPAAPRAPTEPPPLKEEVQRGETAPLTPIIRQIRQQKQIIIRNRPATGTLPFKNKPNRKGVKVKRRKKRKVRTNCINIFP